MSNNKIEPSTIFILAGPNGAGKTTFANRFLPEFVSCREFLNADLIAAGLSPYSPESQVIRASELMLTRIYQLVAAHESFAFETTLGARSYAQMIPRWRLAGYRVVRLPSVEMAIDRVAARVKQGGHRIPETTIRRRFDRGVTNLRELYRPAVNETYIYEASSLPPVLVWKAENGLETVVVEEKWTTMCSSMGNWQ